MPSSAMPEFFDLSAKDRLDALSIVADASGRPLHLLEKDIWVVWALRHLFSGPYAEHLVFKGGTSLSKAYGVIRRFSEDVDLTYDIRAIAADLVGNAEAPLPATKSQERKWTRKIHVRLDHWVATEVVPRLEAELVDANLPATVRAEGPKAYIEYTPVAAGTGYVAPAVLLEFGARSTGEPNEARKITCDAAAYLPEVAFPAALPQVMRAERTFWEKCTAIHVFCAQGAFRGGDRFARHWHDITRLDSAGYADAAIADKELARAVAEHKSVFFAEKSAQGAIVDYHSAVAGRLQLVPGDDLMPILAADYQHMIDDGLFLDDAEPFTALVARCRSIERKANAGS